MTSITEISKEIWQALKDVDSTTLTELVHPNAVFVHMGVTLTRDEEINVLKAGKIIYKHVTFEEQTIHEFDTTVVLLNKMKLTAVVGGNIVINPFVVTEVYSKTNEDLELVSLSYTRINY
ncbi:MAG: nuclear transport factor 2 family protein [Alkalibacterium sp.]|nr:nuclear transport factor 2 family protein [Alkalibacterium sp.]